MATYTKRLLSGSTDGRGIPIGASGTPGTTIHTAVSGSSDLDEIWLYFVNENTISGVVTIEFGGTTALQDTITVTIPFKSGLQLVVPGLLLNNGAIVKAYTAISNIIAQGFVNRITA